MESGWEQYIGAYTYKMESDWEQYIQDGTLIVFVVLQTSLPLLLAGHAHAVELMGVA